MKEASPPWFLQAIGGGNEDNSRFANISGFHFAEQNFKIEGTMLDV